MNPNEERAAAFNQGCDARLAGLSLSDNPFQSGDYFWRYWRQGWIDVDRNWGRWAHWSVRSLPEVKKRFS